MDIHREYLSEVPFTPEEAREFRQMLRDNPELKKHYKDFKTMESLQALRSRLGQSPWLSPELDRLFEIAVISGI